MKLSCPQCVPREYKVPEYTGKQKSSLQKLNTERNFKELLIAIESFHHIETIDAKFVMMHINEKYGCCNRCNFEKLQGEYVNCPKCKALNFNWD